MEVYKTSYNVSYCAVFIDGSELFGFDNVAEGLNTVSALIPSGEHSWLARCYDTNLNYGDSETRMLTVGPVKYYQPLIRVEKEEQVYKLNILNVEYYDTIEAGKDLAIKIDLENTGDFDLKDVSLGVSIYDLDLYNNIKFDLRKGQKITKTFYLEVPEDAVQGYYDLKISLNSDNIKRAAYKELFVT